MKALGRPVATGSGNYKTKGFIGPRTPAQQAAYEAQQCRTQVSNQVATLQRRLRSVAKRV